MWVSDPGDYPIYETFGPGGSIEIDGPDGLIFTGVPTSGDARGGSGWSAGVTFSGQWNDGTFGGGSARVEWQGGVSDASFFVTSTPKAVPEPTSLMLFAPAGIGLFWKLRVRRVARGKSIVLRG